MIKRIFSVILTVAILMTLLPVPQAYGAEPETTEIANEYVKVSVNRKNGGYVITTVEGDILKKSDDNVNLTHRGTNMDTSFTFASNGSEDFVFGNRYGFLGHSSTRRGSQRRILPAIGDQYMECKGYRGGTKNNAGEQQYFRTARERQ